MSELTDEERAAGLIALVEKEADDPKPGWYWLSFVDSEAHRSLGVSIVHAIGPILAVWKSKALGINPGGEVMMQRLSWEPPLDACNRLLDPAEARKVGGLDA